MTVTSHRGVPHVQKGAVLIVKDQTAALIAASALALGLAFGPCAAGAATEHASTPAAAEPAQPSLAGTSAQSAATQPSTLSVVFVEAGTETAYPTSARTVAQFLAERGVVVGGNDFVSDRTDATLEDGMRLEYRRAVPVELFVGKHKALLHSSAATVADFLAQQHVKLAANSDVRPGLQSPLTAGQIVQIVRNRTWTAHVRSRITPRVTQRFDKNLPRGMSRILAQGSPGFRETTIRYWASDNGERTRTVLASRIIRGPRPRIVIRGIADYASLARVAVAGFASVLHFAGTALHAIATGYTAGCAGCSGVTASGYRAGFGIIAVDPNIIPLGTHLFVPGYGRAIAGDTGGAIHGNRVDLGFDTLADAMRFGRRPVTVYLVK
ncbi:MAG: G5 domain-containing protein [Candidatus Eremiobacteraeota bacterium]|nr:G5 domain-containing protein [Candidatus Eremiobacteraeota bacterium]MBC5822531.1 G5 domain-containing protein [Candidatus Eremiobacteraeota bacterium]